MDCQSLVGQYGACSPNLLPVYDIELLFAHDADITSAKPVTMDRSCCGLWVVVIAL